ncbi:MAG: type IV pilus twitching motility protein PilT [Candidatus Omnitrophica bacterium]|nr:type IV pilus twitching motility protein PilT [Candidatus Omnitrophota bacterium]
MRVEDLLHTAVDQKASDLHLTVGLPPQLRIHGALVCLPGSPLTDADTQALAYEMLSPEQIAEFERRKELDTSYSIKGFSRFRLNLFRQRSSIAAAIRTIPFDIPTLQELRLPAILQELALKPSGLMIVSGPTGSGKSTTLAAMLESINERKGCHIISVEDPIEYLHRHRKSTINQRELGCDTDSFQEALRHMVRQDPDVIMIGEMRDLDTMSAALTLAETGHLVLTTLHTSDVVHAIQRIIDVFPAYQQTQIRVQLSLVLTAVIVQQLVPRIDVKGRVVACEVMIATPSVGNLIRENQLHQLKTVLQTGRRVGMQTMNSSLIELYQQGLVSWEEISRRTTDLEELSNLAKALVNH